MKYPPTHQLWRYIHIEHCTAAKLRTLKKNVRPYQFHCSDIHRCINFSQWAGLGPDKSIFCCIYFIFSAAVPKSSHFGIFGILRHKLGLSGSKHKSRSQEHEAEDAYLPDQVLESPQVVRIKCEEGVDVVTGFECGVLG